jgi:glutathione S-transferase
LYVITDLTIHLKGHELKIKYTLYGWQLSYFTGKLRGYMNYKQLDFTEKPCSFYDLKFRIPKHVGSSSMPVIESSEGEWMSDTTDIIEALENRHPEPTIKLASPRQKIVAMLLEAWFDDSWITAAMYTRWQYPKSYALFKHEGAQDLFPYLPNFIRHTIIEHTIMAKLRSYLPGMGICSKQNQAIDHWLRNQLEQLERHFSEHDYLIGGRPSIADYGLLGPIYGHLNRDPWPKHELLDYCPNIQGWATRTHDGTTAAPPLISDDGIANTLLPLLSTIAMEFVPMFRQIVQAAENIVQEKNLQSGDYLPRTFKGVSFPMGTALFQRDVFSYTLWMMQRIKVTYYALEKTEQRSVDDLFTQLNLDSFIQESFGPRVVRAGLGVQLA